MRSLIIKEIEAARVVAIVRDQTGDRVKSTMKALVHGGIKLLEVTANTPNFCDHIRWGRKNFPDCFVGAGTITTNSLAEEAISAGAQFLVTPNMSSIIIDTAIKADIVTLMGAMTPTDIAIGLEAGADFIKLFPACGLGLPYFHAIQGPFDRAKFIAVGGINEGNAAQWLAAGAVGVGIGGSVTNGDYDTVKSNARLLLNNIK